EQLVTYETDIAQGGLVIGHSVNLSGGFFGSGDRLSGQLLIGFVTPAVAPQVKQAFETYVSAWTMSSRDRNTVIGILFVLEGKGKGATDGHRTGQMAGRSGDGVDQRPEHFVGALDHPRASVGGMFADLHLDQLFGQLDDFRHRLGAGGDR